MPRKTVMKKAELLKILNENLEGHDLTFQKTVELFKSNYGEFVNKLLANAFIQKIEDIEMHINLQKPIDHSDDYKRSIRMVELDVREEIDLDEQEFAHCILNEWNWFSSFRHTYLSNYSSSSKSSNSSSSSSSHDEKIKKYLNLD